MTDLAGSLALVTGGAGLIGSHLVQLLVKRGGHARILDSFDPSTHSTQDLPWLPEGVEVIRGDVRDRDLVREAVHGVDFVFHQAAFGGFAPETGKYLDVNAIGTANLFEAIKATQPPVRRVVVASSQAVYGEGQYSCAEHGAQAIHKRSLGQLAAAHWDPFCPVCGRPLRPELIDEEKPQSPLTLYGVSKIAQEKTALLLGADWNIPTVALRYALTYGPRQSFRNPYTAVCTIFAARLLNDVPPIVFEDGQQQRDLIYVEDVAEANLHVTLDDRAVGRALNVGTGRGTTIFHLAQCLAQLLRVELAPQVGGYVRPGDARHLIINPARLESLGWRARTPLEVGLEKLVAWIKTMGPIPDHFGPAFAGLEASGIVRAGRAIRSGGPAQGSL